MRLASWAKHGPGLNSLGKAGNTLCSDWIDVSCDASCPKALRGVDSNLVTGDSNSRKRRIFFGTENDKIKVVRGSRGKTAFENLGWRLSRFRITSSAPAAKRWGTSVLPRTAFDISCLEFGVHRKISPTISHKHTITWSPGLGTDFERCQPLGALQMRPSLWHDRGGHPPGPGDQFSVWRIAAAVLPNWADVKHNYDAK